MAINATITYPETGLIEVRWTGLNASGQNLGVVQQLARWSDKTVQTIGTFGVGGSVTLQGSLVTATGNRAGVRDPQGTLITMATTTGLKAVLENPRYIGPKVTAGDGTTNLTVILIGKRSDV